MSVLADLGRKLALNFVGLDDIVLGRELAENGVQQFSQAGRTLVGGAVVGGGLAARTLSFGAQIGTKSARAATEVFKDVLPGSSLADRVADDLDRQVGGSGERFAQTAGHGAVIGRPDRSGPTNPLTGEPWLDKALGADEHWNTLLANSTIELARLAALPFTLALSVAETAAASPAGRQVNQFAWNTLSAAIDSMSGIREDSGADERMEARASLLALALAPLAVAARDVADLGEGVSRAAFGDLRKLRETLAVALERLVELDPDSRGDGEHSLIRALRRQSRTAAKHLPQRLLEDTEERDAGVGSQYMQLAAALVQDGPSLATVTLIYWELLTRLGVNAAQTVTSGWRDVDEIAAWVRAEDSSQAAKPACVEQLESIVSAMTSAEDGEEARGFYTSEALALAQDTVFSYSTRALDCERALDRVGRLYGKKVRERIANDCSLREELIDAPNALERNRLILAHVSELRRTDVSRLREARDSASERLQSLNRSDSMLELMLPHRVADRSVVLTQFISLTDQALALPTLVDDDAARRRVFAQFEKQLTQLAS